MKFTILYISFCLLVINNIICTAANNKGTVSSLNQFELLINLPTTNNKPSLSSHSKIGKGLLKIINGSNYSIDFAIYGLRGQPEIIEALLKAENRGVKIRGVVDKDIHDNNYYTDTIKLINAFPNKIKTDYEKDLETSQMLEKKKYHIPFWNPPKGFNGPPQCIGYSIPNNKAIIAVHASRKPLTFQGDIMHNKFFIVDKQYVWTGSCNLSDSGTGGYNANIATVVNSPTIAKWYINEFNQMFNEGLFHRDKTVNKKGTTLRTHLNNNVKIECYFSPQGYAMNEGVLPKLEKAQEEINIAVFFLTHKFITAELIKAHNRGVRVRIIIDATAATNGYTKHEILKAAGIPVKIENWGGKMHMKAASIDNKYLILGSMNWTAAGEKKNDENTLIINSPSIVHDYNKSFNIMWNSIPDRWLSDRPDPESHDSPMSVNDGIDNDFDGFIDGEDLGCSQNPPPLQPLPPYYIVPKRDGYDLIKGNINRAGKKYYFLPTDKYYHKTTIDVSKGEKWFPSISEATEAGWKKPWH